MPTRVSVIIAAQNEAKFIGPLVRRLRMWKRKPEVIVVVNGSQDKTAHIARAGGAKVIKFPEALGPDVGRAIGLSVATGNVLVVTDGDIPLFSSDLEPFVRAVEQGVDLALNKYPLRNAPRAHHPTAIAKQAVNLFINRPDLHASSLTAVPHAMSRRLVNHMGAEAFIVPPVAQVRAVLDSKNFRVEAVHHVPVGKYNPVRSSTHQQRMKSLILGDCLEAVAEVISLRGVRGGFTDLNRQRDALLEIDDRGANQELLLEATVVPAQGEPLLEKVVYEARELANCPVVIVENGVDSKASAKRTISDPESVILLPRKEALGHDVGRAFGAMSVAAEKYVFTDADIPVKATDIRGFLADLDQLDVALNRLDDLLVKRKQTDPPSIVKRFLNFACGRPDLGMAALTAVPHAIRREAVERIGFESLAVPPLAHVKFILEGCNVAASRSVDVIRKNMFRPHLHSLEAGRVMQKLILGDHLEALAFLQSALGPRGAFEDDWREREVGTAWILRKQSEDSGQEIVLPD